MNEADLHVVFLPQARPQLEAALRAMHEPARVAALYDTYSVGPIAPDDAADRARWIWRHLYPWWGVNEPEAEHVADVQAFWRDALAPCGRKIAWFTRRDADEFTAFCAWISRLDGECDVVDLTNVPVDFEHASGRTSQAVSSIARVSADDIARNRLLSHAGPLSAPLRRECVALWSRLQGENAPVRTAQDGTLRSVGLSHYDDLIVAQASARWTRAIRILAEAQIAIWESGELGVHQGLMESRILELAKLGRLEARGEPTEDFAQIEVRRP